MPLIASGKASIRCPQALIKPSFYARPLSLSSLPNMETSKHLHFTASQTHTAAAGVGQEQTAETGLHAWCRFSESMEAEPYGFDWNDVNTRPELSITYHPDPATCKNPEGIIEQLWFLPALICLIAMLLMKHRSRL